MTAAGTFLEYNLGDDETLKSSSTSYSIESSALVFGSGGGEADFASGDVGSGNYTNGEASGTFSFTSSAAVVDSGTTSRVNEAYTTMGRALVEFSGSVSEGSRGQAHTVTSSDSEDSDIHSQAIESLYGTASGGVEIDYTLTDRGDRVAASFAVSASTTGRSAAQSYGTVTQRFDYDPVYETYDTSETTPVRSNEAGSTSLAVAVRGSFSDDSLGDGSGATGSASAPVHTESGHVTRTENSAARASAFAGLVLPLEGFEDQEEPYYILPAAGAYSLEKTTVARTSRQDYDYADEGSGLTKRGTFDDDTQRTSEKTRVLANVPLDGISPGTTGTYTSKNDGGTRHNTTTTGSFDETVAGVATVHGTLGRGGTLGGNGDYVTAAQGGGTSQDGRVDTTGNARLKLNGTEGSFKLTPILDYEENQIGQQWSGSLITVTDTGGSTVKNGGNIKIDAAGNVTAKNLSNSDLGNGTRTVAVYAYDGSHTEEAIEDGTIVSDVANRSHDLYTTTTKNTPAKDGQPASKGSTNTHEWSKDNRSKTVTETHVETEAYGEELPVGPFHYASIIDTLTIQQTLSRSEGGESQTVTLTGNKASATIDSWSKSYDEAPASVPEPQYPIAGGYTYSKFDAVYFDGTGEHGAYHSVGSSQSIHTTDQKSHYHSEHTVDSKGHARGGTFTATSKSDEWAGRIVTWESTSYGDSSMGIGSYAWPAHGYTKAELVDGVSRKEGAEEHGSYEDFVIPGIIAVRLQSGSYDKTLVIHQETTFDYELSNPRYGGWAGPVGPIWYQYHESQLSEISTDTIKTKGGYNPFGSSEKVEMYYDYEKHERTHSTHDDPYPDENNPEHDPEGSFAYAHYYSTETHDKEIHLAPGSAKGRVRDVVDTAEGHAAIPYTPVYTENEEDLFEGEPPALPPNPPQSLAMRGEPGEADETPPQDPALAALNNSFLKQLTHPTLDIGITDPYEQYSRDVQRMIGPTWEEIMRARLKIVNIEVIESTVFGDPFRADADRYAQGISSVNPLVLFPSVLGWGMSHLTATVLDTALPPSSPSYLVTYEDGSKTWFMSDGPTTLQMANQALLIAPMFPKGFAGRTPGNLRFAVPESMAVTTIGKLTGFTEAETLMIREAERALAKAGYDITKLKELIKAKMPNGTRGMSLGTDAAALDGSAFSSQQMLNHVLEEELLHVQQKAAGLGQQFGRGTAQGLEEAVDGVRRFPLPSE